MKIRPVVKKDIPQIIELTGDVRAEYDCTLDVEREETYLLAPDEYFRARGGEFRIAAENGEIVATVAVLILDAKTAELKSLYVKKDFRQKGLGEDLTKLAVKFARAAPQAFSLFYALHKDQKEVAADLKLIYQAPTLEQADTENSQIFPTNGVTFIRQPSEAAVSRTGRE